MSDVVPVTRALFSTHDKTGVVALAQAIAAHGAQLISTGGTARALADAGLAVTEVAEHTGSPEMLDGRVKTLHPRVHGGLLGRRDLAEHVAQMQAHDIAPIDLICVNLYPFEATVASGAGYDDVIEQIDIGGPAMIRSAAKNHASVAVLVDPADYPVVLAEIAEKGGTTLATRRRLAAKAYATTGAYDAAISTWFAGQQGTRFPDRLVIAGRLEQTLRYGENPHQAGAFYRTGGRPPVQVQGKELSYNNLNDADAAIALAAEFDPAVPAVVIVKHANPCGVATGPSQYQAWVEALACDPVSAFGGIVALNRKLDGATAAAIAEIFTEVIIAPDADAEAKAVLARKKNLRLLLTGPLAEQKGLTVRSIGGGLLVQEPDLGVLDPAELRVVTKRQPSEQELADMRFAFTVAKHVKSNAIIFARNGASVGIGAGQMSRVDAARIALRKAQDVARVAGEAGPRTQGSVAASDAFFPFADGLDVLVEAGATAVIQPGGSIRDNEVIEAADKAGLAMAFTGVRHFRH
ncbi:bifunctional phosphoribosylaminoimidazolecarboxamide formyltransferase/IMP cyclohydrolase [Zavarzinia sp. CC-PAN008]|uniref:bifunctional phosphoribosylaminoimidazolecarboxamide formyltransferase/IMP cyclohydrolase n=1 Tax=Zavarzinia sp. CC-PAN008 TaxID=3243332 RepID=UPI003F748482